MVKTPPFHGGNTGSGSQNSGAGTNKTEDQPSENDKDNSSPQNSETPSSTGETSHQGSGSNDGTTPDGDQSRTEGSNTQSKPGTNPGSVSDSNTVSGSGSDSTSGASATTGSGSGTGAGSDTNPDANTANGPGKDDANSGEGQRSQDGVQPPSQSTGAQDKGGQTTPQGQDGSANNGQTPAQNQGDQSIGSEAPARNDDAQSSDGKTPAQNASDQGDGSQTHPQNAGGGSDTGNPGTSDTAQTGGTQTDGAQTGGTQTGPSETGSDGKHDGGDSKGDDAKGEDGEQGKNGEDTASPSNPPVTTPPPTPPDYTPNQSIQQAIHANNKPVGASIFNGTNPAHAPSFVKITAVLDKDGEEVPGAMTLGKDGEAITTNQVISKEQFDNVFLDALKAPGGSFKFVPVLDSEGTAMPGVSEQTVSIGVDYLHHFPSQTFSKLFSEEAHLSHYKIFSIAENEDTNGTQDGMLKIDGNERTPLQKGDLIKPEDFDKLYWDYSSNNGGRFIFVGVDSTGRNINDSDGEQLVLEDLAKTRDGQEPPEIQIAGDGEDEGDEEAGISAHSATLHLESFAESASAFHGPSHLSVNGQSTLDNLLEHQVSHGIL